MAARRMRPPCRRARDPHLSKAPHEEGFAEIDAMTPEEADTIRDVFAKIRAMGTMVDDAAAARLVAQELAANPAAALNLIKVVVGLEQERDQFATHIDELNGYIDQLEAQLNAPVQGQSSGGLFSGSTQGSPWGRGPAAPPAYEPQPQPQTAAPWGAPPSPAPWGAPPVQAQPQQQGSGFWGSALRTGAGVAGGLVAFQAVKGLFGGGGDQERERHAFFEGGRDERHEAPRGSDHAETSGGFGGDDRSVGSGGIIADNIDFFGGDDREA
jgi:hypothetical protein